MLPCHNSGENASNTPEIDQNGLYPTQKSPGYLVILGFFSILSAIQPLKGYFR
ncbi:hypothetical protein D3C86_42860 [compost metagenome]